MFRRSRLTLFLFWLVASHSATGADESPARRSTRFRLTVDSELQLNIDRERQLIQTKADVEYSWSQQGSRRELILHSVAVNGTQNGNLLQDFTQSRQQVSEVVDGRRMTTSFEDAAEDVQALLSSTFALTGPV